MLQVLFQYATRVVTTGGQNALAKRNVTAVFGDHHARVRVLSDFLDGKGARRREHVVGGVQEQRGNFDVLNFGVERGVPVVGLARLITELFYSKSHVKISNGIAPGNGGTIKSLVIFENMFIFGKVSAQASG